MAFILAGTDAPTAIVSDKKGRQGYWYCSDT